jgi:hypothetical protein
MLKHPVRLLFLFLCAAAFAVWGANAFFLQRPLAQVVDADARNDGIRVAVHYRYFVDPRSIVYNLQEVRAGATPEDVTRMLAQFASLKKDSTFSAVRLRWQGKDRFLLTGDGFRRLDPNASATLPPGLATPNGMRPDSFIAWHRAWYIDELTEKIRAAMEQAA